MLNAKRLIPRATARGSSGSPPTEIANARYTAFRIPDRGEMHGSAAEATPARHGAERQAEDKLTRLLSWRRTWRLCVVS
jgi:hypothetical protein